MSCTNRFAAAAALVGLLGMSSLTVPAAAQTATASIAALASVSGLAPLTASGVNDLNFRVVTAGTPYTPLNLAADAGRFNLSGELNTMVSVTFTLPERLTGTGGWIPITFGAADGLLWNPTLTSHTTFPPNAPFSTSTGATGNLIIGITGTVSPPVGSITGNYTGTIQLVVAYL